MRKMRLDSIDELSAAHPPDVIVNFALPRHPRVPDGSLPRSCGDRAFLRRRGFNLIELLAVLAITVILIATLMPGLRAARSTTHRIVCASNLRQFGAAMQAYSGDFNERLPHSVHLTLDHWEPQEMMAASAGPDEFGRTKWDGLGLLSNPWNPYVDVPRACYCPSHLGEHSIERYGLAFSKPAFTQEVYTNYHYRGDFDRRLGRYLGTSASRRVIVVDGLRTRRDFNHGDGTNRLHSDASVDWLVDADRSILSGLPFDTVTDPIMQDTLYSWLWDQISRDTR
jgi:prepilin-type N-terminal cleavage/methylation domain-containing protein